MPLFGSKLDYRLIAINCGGVETLPRFSFAMNAHPHLRLGRETGRIKRIMTCNLRLGRETGRIKGRTPTQPSPLFQADA
jgi:hypothetical protein